MQTREQAVADMQKIHQALSLVSEEFVKAGVPYRISSIDGLIDQDLPLAIEILCINLHEFACPIPRQAFALIEEVGRYHIGIDADVWEMLRPQVQR